MNDRDELDPLARIRAAREREQLRVRGIINRDLMDRETDQRRRAARIEVAHGRFVNLQESRDTLPEEQLARDQFDPYETEKVEGTVREPIITVRRVDRVTKLFRAGVLDIEEFACCGWYRGQWERSGLDPLVASTFYPKFGDGPKTFGHLAKTATEAEARDEFRWSRRFVPDDVISLFDQVVLHDFSVREASRLAKCRYTNGSAAFRRGLLGLMVYVAPIIRSMPQRRS
ncbi:hypothetical protein [Sphingomonas sp. NFR15]|uniref:hypothetical protein n=1 Tax=Sphingomonas sp. NFR15 TaxID=1566282 RepID=UPI00089019F1|nr:hypothetical protein [Sphingomonas sp. NFR15]SDA15036.1 hypothetical protein SAMN03159340_00629 [Sphingomonas sp. NFR15]